MASNCFRAVFLIFGLSLSPFVLSEELRTWKDASGGFSIEAELVAQDSTSVTLRTSDKRKIEVPLAKLSSSDRRYLAQMKSRNFARGVLPASTNSLDKRLSEKSDFQFSQVPLSTVLRTLQRDYSLPIILDKAAIEKSGVDAEEKITYSQKQVSIGDALGELLALKTLEWTIDHGVVVVTTLEGAERQLITRVYQMKGGGQPDLFSIEPDSWESLGGPGIVAPFPPRCLIVRQRLVVHQQIIAKFANSLILVPLRPVPQELLHSEIPFDILSKPITLDIRNQPLSELAAKMSEVTKTNVLIDEQAIRDLGLSPNFSITVNLPELPIVNAAIVALKPYSLIISIQSNAIVITTMNSANANANLLLASYNTGTVNRDLLWTALHETISPSSWQALGGSGTIDKSQSGKLQVRQTLDNHLGIAQLLSDLQGF